MVFRLALVIGAASAQSEDRLAYDEWKQAYARSYTTTEDAYRFEVFRTNLRYFEARTANDTAVYGPDEMADRTLDEFLAERTSTNTVSELRSQDNYCFDSYGEQEAMDVQSVLRELGDKVDWKAKGAVTGVKNQGSHGTCWSFTATGIMEGISVAQGNNSLESVSEQELIDCYKPANVGRALDKYYKDQSLSPASEETYPYEGNSGSCRRSSSKITKSKIKKVVCPPNGPKGNQDSVLANLMTYGPGGYLIDASGLHGYQGGVISNMPSTKFVNHGTLVVGAGEENGMAYFLVKNSWGSSFGEDGYYRVKRNTDPPQLGCPGGIFGVYDGLAPTPTDVVV